MQWYQYPDNATIYAVQPYAFSYFWVFLPPFDPEQMAFPTPDLFSINLYFRMDKRAGGISKVDNPEIYRDTAIRALAMSNAVMVSELTDCYDGKQN